ncbi:hypothetical protein CSPHI_00670 [Corynebacterium sphenisci DSM 44792]|uniref:VWFA domain-containing protein n=1 Tax=Corynebacterium sphenisci DSM 44792 TaxID=1437874 RepID=A0A1L7CVL8_9CORY|nr:SpaA isopeptide-forming pilin-related protein [Corynebacterium sphenisci]APT89850.1 hypothetical protein CSPHI_00670 [Corynebacterium sphenisci DSM 44792]
MATPRNGSIRRALPRRAIALVSVSAMLLLGGNAAGAQEAIPAEETSTTTAEQTTTAEPTTAETTTADVPTAEPSADPAPAEDPAPAPEPATTEPAPSTAEETPGTGEGDEAIAEEEPEATEGDDGEAAEDGGFIESGEPVELPGQLSPGADRPTPRMGRAGGYPDWFTENPAPNPSAPVRCGLRVALVFDLSGSIGAAGEQGSQDAANGVIDELAGTPAEIGIYNFAYEGGQVPQATGGPYSMLDDADVAAARNNAQNLRRPSNAWTNTEAGVKEVPLGLYDIVYFVTDGKPTTNDARTGGYPMGAHAADVTDAIIAANRLKESGTRIVPIGVGLGNTKFFPYRNDIEVGYRATKVRDRLYIIYQGGETVARWTGSRYKDYYRKNGRKEYYRDHPELWSVEETNPYSGRRLLRDLSSRDAPIEVDTYQEVPVRLVEQILAGCRGRVDVTKRIVDDQGNELSRGEGWEFTASTADPVLEDGSERVDSLARVTDAEGRTGFRVDAKKPLEVTLTETAQEGFALSPQEGKNARCFTSKNGKRVPVEVRDKGENGFAVTMPELKNRLGAVDCIVDNREVPTAAARKEPVLGEPVQVNPDGTAELSYTVTVANPSTANEAAAGELFDIIRLPADVVAAGDATVAFAEVDGVEVTGPTATIAQAELTRDSRVRLAESATLAPGKELPVTVTIPVQVEDIAGADWDRLGRCEGDGSTVSPVGVPNSVELAGDEDPADDNACIPLTPPREAVVNIAKVDNEDTLTPLDGSEFALYGSTPDGSIDWDDRITGGPGNDRLAEGVREGRYHLVETKAPEGYALLASPVAVEVTGHAEGYTIALADDADGGLVAVGPGEEDAAADELWVRVADLTTGTLPKTGGTGPAPFALAALLAFAAALAARRRLS